MLEVEAEEVRSGIQVIARAANILRSLKNEQTGLSLGQIAERVNLPRSTVQRIVGALLSERFVIAAGPERGIRLGPELQSLAESSKIDIAEVLRPYLTELSRETGETVDLAVVRNDKLIFLDQISGNHRLRAVSSVGDVFPMTSTANGKACLALMSNEEVLRIARIEANPRSGRSLKSLVDEIEKVRKTQVAFDDDEHTMGISAVGIAFRDWHGSLYAVSVPAPTARLAKNRKQVTEALKGLAVKISKILAALEKV